MPLPPGLHGAHRRRDLTAALGRRTVEGLLRTGVAAVLWRVTVVESARLLDPWTRAAAAVLTAGDDAVVCGSTAAQLHGLTALDDVRSHLALPYCRGVRGRDGLVVHHAQDIRRDVVQLAGLPVLALDRVVSDLLCTLPRRTDALALIDEALRLAGREHQELRRRIGDRISRRPDPRGTVIGAALLDLASERAESLPESWVRWRLVEHGLPLPEVNHPLLGVDGVEVRRLDLAWPQLRVALEYDGYVPHHGRADQDAARADDLRRRGWIVVRMGADDLADLGRVLHELRAAFARRGYTW
jgi:hypothetical protein